MTGEQPIYLENTQEGSLSRQKGLTPMRSLKHFPKNQWTEADTGIVTRTPQVVLSLLTERNSILHDFKAPTCLSSKVTLPAECKNNSSMKLYTSWIIPVWNCTLQQRKKGTSPPLSVPHHPAHPDRCSRKGNSHLKFKTLTRQHQGAEEENDKKMFLC